MSENVDMLLSYCNKSIKEIKKVVEEYINSPTKNLTDKTPKEALEEMNTLALYVKAGFDEDDVAFNRIHAYLHSYIFNESYSHFTIKGMEGKDLYQNGLIALWSKAIPGFNSNKGMSFVNFAKMCIYRHFVTLLNVSNNRKKDRALNTAVSIDCPLNNDDNDKGDGGTMANLLADDINFMDGICSDEDKSKTVGILMDTLSSLEKSVFRCYLEKMTYREIAAAISNTHGRTYDEKSVDNALLRIRSKAWEMKGKNVLPLFSLD